jgi:hypothetical protein
MIVVPSVGTLKTEPICSLRRGICAMSFMRRFPWRALEHSCRNGTKAEMLSVVGAVVWDNRQIVQDPPIHVQSRLLNGFLDGKRLVVART